MNVQFLIFLYSNRWCNFKIQWQCHEQQRLLGSSTADAQLSHKDLDSNPWPLSPILSSTILRNQEGVQAWLMLLLYGAKKYFLWLTWRLRKYKYVWRQKKASRWSLNELCWNFFSSPCYPLSSYMSICFVTMQTGLELGSQVACVTTYGCFSNTEKI